MEKQDKRNKEIALEKTVEDTKKQILEVDMSDCKFGQDEDKMIYFFLLSSLRKEHFEAVGIEEKKPYSYLTDEEKINIIANLTSKQKAIIRRDFLIANFKNAYGNNAIASLLLDFAQITLKYLPTPYLLSVSPFLYKWWSPTFDYKFSPIYHHLSSFPAIEIPVVRIPTEL